MYNFLSNSFWAAFLKMFCLQHYYAYLCYTKRNEQLKVTTVASYAFFMLEKLGVMKYKLKQEQSSQGRFEKSNTNNASDI